MKRFSLLIALTLLLAAGVAPGLAADADAPGYVMRHADIGGGHIVFTYEGDLWLVPEAGGDARRITSHVGTEQFAKFNSDGTKLAFSAEYDGGRDIYEMDVDGGVPRRLTWHPARDQMLDWCPDDSGVIINSARERPYLSQIFKVFVDGGMPFKLPIDRGALASAAPDQNGLAYNRLGRQNRTWKRYEGGLAQDVWVKDFKTNEITNITDNDATDSFPMWGDGAIYFMSDREDGTLNLYAYDTTTKQTRRLTMFKEYDVKFPSYGDGKIIFQYGPGLSVYDTASGQVRDVPINIPSDRRHLRPELMTAAPTGGTLQLSPAGERALLEFRGEILNLPAEDGDALNVTRTSGSREKNAVWSPDGRWLALVSDRSGEEQIYLVDQHGAENWRQVTDGFYGFTNPSVWSPDSKHLAFSDKFMKLHLVDVDAGQVSEIAHSDYDDAWERWGIMDYAWSPDSRWLAYTSQTANMHEAIWLHDTQSGRNTKLTDDVHSDWSPSFSADGKYLYFLSNRTFDPIMGRNDQNHIFLKMALPYLVLLQADARSPFYEDDVVVVADTGDEADKKGGDKKDDEDAPSGIDLDGIASRILACEGVEAHNYFRLEAIDGGFVMLRKNDPEFSKYQNVNDHTGDTLDLLKYDLAEAELSDLMSGVANYHLSADGKKLIYRAGGSYGVVDAGKPAKAGDGKLDPGAVKIRVDRLQEFPQIFDEAWRIQRDWFYDANMHGVDWQAMHDKYAPFVAGCGTRGDLNYLIGEMIGELNIGHTYIFGGDYEDGPERVNTGVLGCEFALDKGDEYYRFAEIIQGVSWDPRYRSPLAEPGVGVKQGDYLIAIDGVEVKAPDNVYAHLENKARAMVTLTVNSKPEAKGARKVRLRTLRSEAALRYRAWVDANLDYVTEMSDGRIGYLQVPNMGQSGLVEFGRSYYWQTGREAMIIDDRWNGGGFVGDMIIDRLERELWALSYPREGLEGRNPERTMHGPLVVLINEETYSNGEFFAEAVKRLGLATVIGVRTWGGSTGIEAHQDMMDGGGTTPPQFGLYGIDGTWPIEGWGVVPDIVVMNMPADVVAGEDTQLVYAIDYLLKQLADSGGKWDLPEKPAYPVKAKPEMSGVELR